MNDLRSIQLEELSNNISYFTLKFCKDKSGVDKIRNFGRKSKLHQKTEYKNCDDNHVHIDKIIVKKQPYQLLNASREFFPSFHASNIHKFCILFECAKQREGG